MAGFFIPYIYGINFGLKNAQLPDHDKGSWIKQPLLIF